MTTGGPEDAPNETPEERAAKIVREITDVLFQVSVDTDERARFLADPSAYLADKGLSDKARQILGSVNEKLILGGIYELQPEVRPIPVIYTYTVVDVLDSVIVSPVAFIAVYLAPGPLPQ